MWCDSGRHASGHNPKVKSIKSNPRVIASHCMKYIRATSQVANQLTTPVVNNYNFLRILSIVDIIEVRMNCKSKSFLVLTLVKLMNQVYGLDSLMIQVLTWVWHFMMLPICFRHFYTLCSQFMFSWRGMWSLRVNYLLNTFTKKKTG